MVRDVGIPRLATNDLKFGWGESIIGLTFSLLYKGQFVSGVIIKEIYGPYFPEVGGGSCSFHRKGPPAALEATTYHNRN